MKTNYSLIVFQKTKNSLNFDFGKEFTWLIFFNSNPFLISCLNFTALDCVIFHRTFDIDEVTYCTLDSSIGS